METSPESFTFTVGKLDAGMAILLGERAHLIEFPSILLPPGTTAGSIVNIAVHQNLQEEKKRDGEFWALQDEILEQFGVRCPEPPNLELRNVTQTSVTLEWPPLQLAAAKLRSLDIYRSGQRLASIPSPLTNTSTKLSGLEINYEYTFQLILRTTAGTYPSNVIRVRTHTMTDTSGISVCFGTVGDPALLENAKTALQEMRARWSDKIQIDTTHFVCTTPAAPTSSGAQPSGVLANAPGVEYQRALQLSIPVVQPQWILACHSERKMVPIASFYLGTNVNTAPTFHSRSMSQTAQRQQPSSPSATNKFANRASMPPPARTPPGTSSTFVNQPSNDARSNQFGPTPEEPIAEAEQDVTTTTTVSETSKEGKRKSRSGTMNRDFKFPPEPSQSKSSLGRIVPARQDSKRDEANGEEDGLTTADVIVPSSVEVPAPTPVEKERPVGLEEGDEEVGPTEEISLN